jgi:hypothetical protein
MDEQVLMDFVDAVSDDAYGIAELWSITRGRGVTETEARQRAREALIELQRRGYVQFLLEPKLGTWHDLSPEEIEQVITDPSLWGFGTDLTHLSIAATDRGKEVLRAKKSEGRER